MAESLREKQTRFAGLIAHLILWAHDHGYQLTLSWSYRPEPCNKQVGGKPGSLHGLRLAQDLCLFTYNVKANRWVYRRSTKAYTQLGQYWKMLAPDTAWGGDWGVATGGMEVISAWSTREDVDTLLNIYSYT